MRRGNVAGREGNQVHFWAEKTPESRSEVSDQALGRGCEAAL